MKQLTAIAEKREELLKQYPNLMAEVEASRAKVVDQLDQYLATAESTLKGKGDFIYHAQDIAEAQKMIMKLCADKDKLVRISCPELDEIHFDQLMAEHGKEVDATNIGEIIVQQAGLTGYKHPLLANLEDMEQAEVMKHLQAYVGEAIAEPRQLAQAVRQKIKADVLASDYGVSNVDAIIAENGTVIVAESEGNGRLVTNLPYRHIIVAGYDRLYDTAEEAMRGIQAATIFGLGKNNPTYYSLISGQSRTADIEFQMAYGMHGPLEVHLILLDNGRKKLIERGCGKLLKCIDCGGCFSALASWAKANQWPSTTLTAKHIGLCAIRDEISNTQGQPEQFACPVGITAADLEQCFS